MYINDNLALSTNPFFGLGIGPLDQDFGDSGGSPPPPPPTPTPSSGNFWDNLNSVLQPVTKIVTTGSNIINSLKPGSQQQVQPVQQQQLTPQQVVQQQQAAGGGMSTTTKILLGVGGLALVGGITYAIVSGKKKKK